MTRILLEFGILSFLFAVANKVFSIAGTLAQITMDLFQWPLVSDLFTLLIYLSLIYLVGLRFGRRSGDIATSGFSWAMACLSIPVWIIANTAAGLILAPERTTNSLQSMQILFANIGISIWIIGIFVLASAIYIIVTRIVFRYATKRGAWKAEADVHNVF